MSPAGCHGSTIEYAITYTHGDSTTTASRRLAGDDLTISRPGGAYDPATAL